MKVIVYSKNSNDEFIIVWVLVRNSLDIFKKKPDYEKVSKDIEIRSSKKYSLYFSLHEYIKYIDKNKKNLDLGKLKDMEEEIQKKLENYDKKALDILVDYLGQAYEKTLPPNHVRTLFDDIGKLMSQDSLYVEMCRAFNVGQRKKCPGYFMHVPKNENFENFKFDPDCIITKPKTLDNPNDIPIFGPTIPNAKQPYYKHLFPNSSGEMKIRPLSRMRYTVTKSKLGVFKGSAHPPDKVLNKWGGFHPARIFKVECRQHDSEKDPIWGWRDFHAISTTTDINIAHAYDTSFYRFAESTSKKLGFIYLIFAPPGAISDQNCLHKEVNIIDGVDQNDIIAYRETAQDNTTPIYVRKSAISKYGTTIIAKFLVHYLKEDEVLYLSSFEPVSDEKNHLRKFLKIIIEELNGHTNMSNANLDYIIPSHLHIIKKSLYLDKYTCNEYIERFKNTRFEQFLLEIILFLALKFGEDEYFCKLITSKVINQETCMKYLSQYFKKQLTVNFDTFKTLAEKLESKISILNSGKFHPEKFLSALTKLQQVGCSFFEEWNIFGNSTSFRDMLEKFLPDGQLLILRHLRILAKKNKLDLKHLCKTAEDTNSILSVLGEFEQRIDAIKILIDIPVELKLSEAESDIFFLVTMVFYYCHKKMADTQLKVAIEKIQSSIPIKKQRHLIFTMSTDLKGLKDKLKKDIKIGSNDNCFWGKFTSNECNENESELSGIKDIDHFILIAKKMISMMSSFINHHDNPKNGSQPAFDRTIF